MSNLSRPALWISVVSALVALVIRFLCARGELWFDELWSLSMTRDSASPIDALLIPHDNRHPLTSFWLQLLPTTAPALVFRFQSLIWSSVTLLMLLLLHTRKESLSLLFWIFLYSFSYLFILYDSEARGYAGMISCAAILYVFRWEILKENSVRATALYSVVASLGILSHALFLLVLGPYLSWLWIQTLNRCEYWPSTKKATYIALLLILGLAVPLYAKMEIGGAPIVPFAQVFGDCLLLMFGGSAISPSDIDRTVWQLFAVAFYFILSCIELILWWKKEKHEAGLVGLLVFFPIVIALIVQPHFLLPRYFLTSIFFCLLLFARFLARLCEQNQFGVALACGIGLAWMFGNAQHVLRLGKYGRSTLEATLQQISLSKDPSIGGNLGYQLSKRIPLLRQRNDSLQRIHFVADYENNDLPPAYLLIESFDRAEIPAQKLTTANGAHYTLDSQWTAPPESGANLSVYKFFRKD